MTQPAAKVSASDVERLLVRDFPPQEVSVARRALAEYGTKDWHREPERVRAAAMKLAAGSIERLREVLQTADQDFRDVVTEAEYPRYIREIGPKDKDEAKRQAIVEDDWRQYREWFDKNA
jgi:hypothetical protein